MFQRVEATRAGPNALGVLVPHGMRTLVVIRPRALAWDILPALWDGDAATPPRFCTFSRAEAPAVAKQFVANLEAAVAAGSDPLQTFGNAEAGPLQIWLRTRDLVWIVCERTPGRAYEPAMFATLEEAMAAGAKIGRYVFPPMDEVQEYYFNTQSFA